jgi:superfamily II DNA or RNA helicase
MTELKYDSKKDLGLLISDRLEEIREHFSIKNEAAKFIRGYGRFAPQRTYAITATGKFDPCLAVEIKKYFISNQYSDELKVDEDLLNAVKPSRVWQNDTRFTTDIIPLSLSLRDYQEEIVKSAFNTGRGTVVLATAGGKTLTAASLLTKLFVLKGSKFKCLYVVPDLSLVEQTFSDFASYNVPFSTRKWTGSNPIEQDKISPANVIIANLGILQSKNSDLTWLATIDALIVDEVHKIRRGNEVNKLFKIIKTPCRFGFTGTMPECPLDQWNIIGKIGPVIYEKTSYQLRLESYVSNVSVVVLQINYSKQPQYPKELINASDRYRTEINFLVKNDFRNNLLTKFSCGTNKNTLILVDFIEHGEILFNKLSETCNNKQVFFIRGEVEVDEREKVRKLMEEHDNVVVVAISKIFSTGINIKNLHYIIFAGGGKAKVKILQSIGRGLRLHKDKDKLIIVDIADNLQYGYQHFSKRKALYEKENITYQIKEVQE